MQALFYYFLRFGTTVILVVCLAGINGKAREDPVDSDETAIPLSAAEPENLSSRASFIEETFLKGSLSFYGGKYDECVESMDKVLEVDPEFREAFLVKGMAFMLTERIDEARAAFTTFGEKDPEQSEGFNLVGKILFEYGHLTESEHFFAKALGLSPHDPKIYNNLGSVYVKKGDIDLARETFEKGLRLDFEVPELHVNIGIVYFIRNDLDAAEASFISAIKIYDSLGIDDPVAYANLGDVYFENDDIVGAIKAYGLALQCDDTLSDVRTRLAMALHVIDEVEMAREQYEIAISMGGELIEAHTNLALIHLDEGRPFDAVREYKAALRMSGGHDAYSLKELAHIMMSMNEFDEALRYYEIAFEAGDRSIKVLASLSFLSERVGDGDEALAYFKLLEEKSYDDPVALYEIARRCSDSGVTGIMNPEKALEISKILAEDTGWKHLGVLNTMADAYAGLGEFGKAVDIQKSVITQMPLDSPVLSLLKARLRSYEIRVVDQTAP